MLLAFGVWLVNQEAICPEELNLSGNLIGKFVMLFDALYGKLTAASTLTCESGSSFVLLR